jgi:hypothetical protein
MKIAPAGEAATTKDARNTKQPRNVGMGIENRLFMLAGFVPDHSKPS